MADIFSSQKRSEIMSKIRGKNTGPERLVFSYLRKQGVYFQKHYRSKQGIVLDLALPRKKRTVFIDGDFWHGRSYERVLSKRGEDDFWTKKLRRNIERDKEQRKKLDDAGWSVISVWESDLSRVKTRQDTLSKISDFLTAPVN